MKSYIQDLCGDENPVDIDCAILQCMLQDAIFEKLVGKPFNTDVMAELKDVIHGIIDPHLPVYPVLYMKTLYEDLKRNAREIK